MILNYIKLGKQNKGSSLNFSASGGWDKEKKEKAAEKRAVGSEGEAEGGCGGNSASPEPKRSPAALLVQSRGQQKSFLFLLEEKIAREKIKKCEENFFAGQRAKRAAAGRSVQNSKSGFSSKKVRILSKRYRQFSKFGFWAIVAEPRQGRGSASARILKGNLKSKNNFCPLKRKFAERSTGKTKFYKPIFFSFAEGERQSDNFKYFDCLIKTI